MSKLIVAIILFCLGFSGLAWASPELRALDADLAELRASAAAAPEVDRDIFFASLGPVDIPYVREQALLGGFPMAAMPARFRIFESNPEESRVNAWQRVIDHAHAIIFSTPMGVEVCKFSLGNPEQMRSLFGVSLEFARRFGEICTPASGVLPHNAFQDSPQRNYTLLLSSSRSMSLVSGLTLPDSRTLLIFDESNLSAADIVAAFSHEIGIRFDGISADGLSFFAFHAELSPPEGDEAQKFICLGKQPVIAEALRLIRAFAVEAKTMTSMGFSHQHPFLRGELSCMDGVRALIPFAEEYVEKVLPGAMREYLRMDKCAGMHSVENAIAELDKLSLIKIAGGVSPACEAMSAPKLFLDIYSHIRIGPRPNMAGGWGSGSKGKRGGD